MSSYEQAKVIKFKWLLHHFERFPLGNPSQLLVISLLCAHVALGNLRISSYGVAMVMQLERQIQLLERSPLGSLPQALMASLSLDHLQLSIGYSQFWTGTSVEEVSTVHNLEILVMSLFCGLVTFRNINISSCGRATVIDVGQLAQLLEKSPSSTVLCAIVG